MLRMRPFFLLVSEKRFHDPAGSIFLIALIFQVPFAETTIKVLHIFRTLPSRFRISYLQSTIALAGLNVAQRAGHSHL